MAPKFRAKFRAFWARLQNLELSVDSGKNNDYFTIRVNPVDVEELLWKPGTSLNKNATFVSPKDTFEDSGPVKLYLYMPFPKPSVEGVINYQPSKPYPMPQG